MWVEAVVAAPIWAFAHLDTDGEGVGQRAQTGYLFIVNVLFRPSLMVVGFILGSMMVDILTEYVMKLFPIIIANSSMNSWTGLIKIAAYIASFVIILQMIVNMSFQMIRFVPDQVLGWVGGNQTNQIGSHAADEVGGAARNAMAARGSVTGAMASAANTQKARAEKAAKDRVGGVAGAVGQWAGERSGVAQAATSTSSPHLDQGGNHSNGDRTGDGGGAGAKPVDSKKLAKDIVAEQNADEDKPKG